jgi:hypothetical protein
VCDPEHLGFGLLRMLPPALRGDFQDLAAWRQGVYEMLDTASRRYDGPVIVPMTLVDIHYFAEIVGRLRDASHEVRHFALLADPTTVLRRLNKRGLWPGLKRESWAVARLDDYLKRLNEAEFAEHIHTDHRTVSQVADAVARSVGLPITPDTDGHCAHSSVGTQRVCATSDSTDSDNSAQQTISVTTLSETGSRQGPPSRAQGTTYLQSHSLPARRG